MVTESTNKVSCD